MDHYNHLDELDILDLRLINRVLSEEYRSLESLLDQIDDTLVVREISLLKNQIDYVMGIVANSYGYYEDKAKEKE